MDREDDRAPAWVRRYARNTVVTIVAIAVTAEIVFVFWSALHK